MDNKAEEEQTCPECSSPTTWKYTCPTYPSSQNGKIIMMRCEDCNNGTIYSCTSENCMWEWETSLNAASPRTEKNNAKAPTWAETAYQA